MNRKLFILSLVLLSAFSSCDNIDKKPIAYIDFSSMWDYSPDNKEQVTEMWDVLHTTATLQGHRWKRCFQNIRTDYSSSVNPDDDNNIPVLILVAVD